MTSSRHIAPDTLAELPSLLYSALRAVRLYPSSNPQVTRSVDRFLVVLEEVLNTVSGEASIGLSEGRILINGTPLPDREQQRPQVQGLAELLAGLNIHSLSFQRGFNRKDCLLFLEILSLASGSMGENKPLKEQLEEVGFQSVRVDEKRYVAIHEGEQVVGENQLLGSGSSLDEIAGNPALLATMLLNPDRAEQVADHLENIVHQLDNRHLDSLLFQLIDGKHSKSDKKREQARKILEQLQQSDRAEEVLEAGSRIKRANAFINLKDKPTPERIRDELGRPEQAARLLVTALRLLAGKAQEPWVPTAMTNLLDRYEQETPPDRYNQLTDLAGRELTVLQDRELGCILSQQFHGVFGKYLFEAIIDHLGDDQFERIVQELNLLARNRNAETVTSLSAADIRKAHERLMLSTRGRQLQALLNRQQENEPPRINEEKMREGIKSLLAGDHSVLLEESLPPTLPEAVHRLLTNSKNEAADKLLIQIVRGLQHEQETVRKASARTLALTVARLAETGEWQRLGKLLPALEQSLPFIPDRATAGRALFAVEQLTRHHLEQQRFTEAVNPLTLLFDLTIKPPGKNKDLQDCAFENLDALADQDLLAMLLDTIIKGGEPGEKCTHLISRLGARAADFLMSRLSISESREERELLLRLIGEIGKPARDALLHHFDPAAPWYVTRNIIRLLKEVGDPGCFATIAPLINHDDERVRREVVKTIGATGATRRKDFFLKELNRADDTLKPLIARQLGKIRDESIVLPLADMLLASGGGPPSEARETLQVELCLALARIGSKKALPALKKVVKTKEIPGLEDYSAKVLSAAENAVQAISSNATVADPDSVTGTTASPTPAVRKHDPLAEQEAGIFRKAAGGDKDGAKKELFELIVSCAKNKDFVNAERLRERMYEIDPMALTEIIRSGELIEREKTGAVSRNMFDTWRNLLKKLNKVEFSAIYHELSERTYRAEEIIIRQGERNDDLYFLHQGSIKISYTRDGREIFVSSLNSGQIIGENFFTPSIWTVTLTALTTVRLAVLTRESFEQWQEEFPGLEDKLLSFCKQCNSTREQLERKGLDRRQHKRFRISRKTQIQMIDHNRKPIGRAFRGELVDISRGGLAFLIRISKKENSRLLLGRTMRITIPVAGDPPHLHLDGLAISVQPFELLESDFSVHVRFSDLLEEDTLMQILG